MCRTRKIENLNFIRIAVFFKENIRAVIKLQKCRNHGGLEIKLYITFDNCVKLLMPSYQITIKTVVNR